MQLKLQLSTILQLLSISTYFAIPVFHTVNDFDLNGNKCPLQPNRAAKCLPVCVKSLDKCPEQLQPSCKSDEKFCDDGTCRKSCNFIINPCACGSSNSEYVACSTTFAVKIDQFDPLKKEQLIKDQCSKDLDLKLGTLEEGTNDKDTMYWGICPKQLPPQFTYTEPMWIAVFTVVCFEAALLLLWTLYKMFMERNVERMLASEQTTYPLAEKLQSKSPTLEKKGSSDLINSKSSSDKDTLDRESFQIKGFQFSYIGTGILYTVGIISVGWIIYLGFITADYYGAVDGYEYGIAHRSYDLSSTMFIAVWISAVSWFFILNVFKNRLHNFFRIESSPLQANYIQVETVKSQVLMLDDSSYLLKLTARIESNLKKLLGWDVFVTTSKLNVTEEGRYYFNYQCTRYVYFDDRFQPFQFDLGDDGHHLLKNKDGLSAKEAKLRLELKGPNFIRVQVPNFFMGLAQELSSFFYLYQLSIMWLFYYLAYYQVGVADTAVILISAIIKTVIRLKSESRIKAMAEHKSNVKILRDGNWLEVSSDELVPGDVIQVDNGSSMPCDGIVLSGNIVADESSLTGEPLPIRKFPIKDERVSYDKLGTHKINSLFAGTTITQALAKGDELVTCLVTQTSTSTDKGQLVHNILFPNPISFIFDEQLKVVLAILCVWGIVLFALSLWLMQKGGTASWFYGMFCLSQIISPLLPAALVVGQSVAASRLRGKQIYCVDLPRIMIAGKVRIFCFDKTGTLTKEGLDYYGAQSFLPDTDEKFIEDYNTLPNLLQLGIASCHAVTKVQEKLIGNPVDIEMFSATKWKLSDVPELNYVDSLTSSTDLSRKCHIVKRFEFVHSRASMSVAVLDETTKHVHIFVKGSFEKLKALANSNSIPHNYDQVTTDLARQGCYVLAMAHSDLGPIDPEELKHLSREELEENIDMVGLVVFKNKLKEDTREAILELKDGDTRTVMITGDTALTGIYIAKACGMSNPDSKVYLADLIDNQVKWIDSDNTTTNEYLDTTAVSDMIKNDPTNLIELAITGKAFQQLNESNLVRPLLLKTRVFARMTPQDKVDCVQLHMEVGITAMCGDGGNDCGALRAAHVGLALSEAEASIVSPFSSNNRTIQSCVELLRQSRAALATSFAGYKYLIMYGEIMASLKIVSFYFSLQMAAQNWIVIDVFIIVLMAIAVSQSKPEQRLHPSRPTAKILGVETMTSTLGQIFINFAFVAGAYGLLYRESWFKCFEFDASTVDITKWYLLGDNFEAATLTFVTLYQFVNAAAIYNFGYQYRRAWYRNYTLVILYIGFMAFISCLLLMDPNWLGCQLRLNCGDKDYLKDHYNYEPSYDIPSYNILAGHNVFPSTFRYKLFGYCIANIVIGLAWEKLGVLGPMRKYLIGKNKDRKVIPL